MTRYLLNFRLLIAAILASTLPVTSACATTQAISQVVEAVQQPLDRFFPSRADERAYYGLLSFERYANQLSIAAVDLGFITAGSPEAIRIADLLQQLTRIVQAAQQAKRLNDAPGAMDKIREGKALYTQIMGLLGR